MKSEPLRIGVIGLGFMGRNHLRGYGELEEVEVVAVADPDQAVLERAVRGHRARPYRDYRRLLEREELDAVSIAVPTGLHREVALAAIEAGLHVLIEKPIAGTVEEGLEIAHAARLRGVKATVGHVERFNPGVAEMKRQLAAGTIGRVYQVQARRVGPFQRRMRDVGVVHDLATHDLDVMRYLLDQEVVRLYSLTRSGLVTPYEDALLAVLEFEDGISALLDVNWLSPMKVRQLTLLGELGILTLDYINQELFLYQGAGQPTGWAEPAALHLTPEEVRKIHVHKQEPLLAELAAFVGAVLRDEAPPVTCEDAIAALHLAERLVESGQTGRAVSVANPLAGGESR